MMGVLKDLTQAVTDELNSDGCKAALTAAAVTLDFTAIRRTQPRWTLEEIAELKVSVSDRLWQKESYTRAVADDRTTITLEINFQQRIETTPGVEEQDLVDDLVALVEILADYFPLHGRLDGYPSHEVQAVALANNQPVHLKDLATLNAFNSSIVLTFRKM